MADATVEKILDRQEIVDTITRLFVGTDRRDWLQVESCLADEVTLDMTSLAGGKPMKMSSVQVAKGWKDGLQVIDQVHHQVSNFEVTISGDEASATCYGITFHHRMLNSPDNVRTFVGSYLIHLIRANPGWKIDRFRYDSKFVAGNLELENATVR